MLISRTPSQVVGLLACQANSYLKTLNATVVSCENKKDGYEVELTDTVLFPEGGGQPNDTGSIEIDGKSIPVLNVQRNGLSAVHLVKEPLQLGAQVVLKVDWSRRLDHMQQHTGQHLLSAILDKRNLETLSWNLGAKVNYIELPRKLTDPEVEQVQQEVNQAIRDSIPIQVHIPDGLVENKIPDDYDLEKGVIRVVQIGELDKNPCCGTHLKSTAEVGALALLHSQPIRGTNSRLFFIAGDRVPAFAAESNQQLRQINSLLSCQTSEIADKIAKLNFQVKDATNKERFWIGEVARYEALSIKQELESRDVVFRYKPEANINFIKALDKEISSLKPSGTYVLACGQGSEGGALLVAGDKTADIAESIKKLIPDVKGGGKGKWQGKVLEWKKQELKGLLELFDK